MGNYFEMTPSAIVYQGMTACSVEGKEFVVRANGKREFL